MQQVGEDDEGLRRGRVEQQERGEILAYVSNVMRSLRWARECTHVRALDVAAVGAVRRIRHQQVLEGAVQRAVAGREDLQVGVGAARVAPQRLQRLPLALLRARALVQRQQRPLCLTRSLQRCLVAALCQPELVADRAPPHLAAGARADAAPPEIARGGIGDGAAPPRQHLALPEVAEAGLVAVTAQRVAAEAVVAAALGLARRRHHARVLAQVAPLLLLALGRQPRGPRAREHRLLLFGDGQRVDHRVAAPQRRERDRRRAGLPLLAVGAALARLQRVFVLFVARCGEYLQRCR